VLLSFCHPAIPSLWSGNASSSAGFLFFPPERFGSGQFEAQAAATSIDTLKKRYVDIAACYRLLAREREWLIRTAAIDGDEPLGPTARRCWRTRARSALKASSPRSATAATHRGRGLDWVKKTCAQLETLTIAGFALDGNDWDGICVGRRKGGQLIYAGKDSTRNHPPSYASASCP
jgi:hypothetical protein